MLKNIRWIASGQTQDVDYGKKFVSEQIPNGNDEIISKH